MNKQVSKKTSVTLTSHNRSKIMAATLILVITFSAVIAIFPSAFAQTELPGYTPVQDRDTSTVVGVSPTNLGLGQKVIIYIMTYPAPAGPTYYAQDMANALTGGLRNIEMTLTKPDGTSETFMPVDETLKAVGIEIPGLAQIVGTLMYYYYPDQVGEYTVTASFGGMHYTTDNVYEDLKLSVYYKPSSTESATTFTVQEDEVLSGQLNGYPWSPLPENYWENPVQTDNREWFQVSGDWVQGELLVQQYISSYNEYSTAPNSPHILWANEVGQGGLPGGVWGSLPYSGGGGAGNIILDGKIYQASSKAGYFECVDLRTGELLWTAPGNPTLARRLDPTFQTASQANEGGIAVELWEASGSSWKRYDPFDGDLVQTITNAPTDLDTIAFSDGNPYVIIIQSAGGNIWGFGNPAYNNTRPMGIDYCNLIKWDSSKVVGNDWSTGIVWNVSTIDTTLDIYKGEVTMGDNGFFGVRAFPFPAANVIVVRTHNAMQIMEGYDYTTGEFLWRNNNTVLDIGVNDVDGGPSGPIILLDGATQSFVAYDVTNGEEIWRASMGELPWGMTPDYCYCIHDGVFFTGSYDGHVYAYDLDDGSQIWQSDYIGDEDEALYGHQPFNGNAVGADGVLYFSTATVYQLMPRTRFHTLVAINETTCEFIWELPIGAQPTAIADGYLIATDDENGIQYCIGTGKTETTVTAPSVTVESGTAVLLQGSVLDLSPSASGTAAVSEEDMSVWMDYMYGQNATLINNPPMPNGVSVTLTAINQQNGEVTEVGTTTSSMDGTFGLKWTPPEEGLYKIVASFLGSESYWSSYDTTYLSVGPQTSASTPIEPEQPTPEEPATEEPTPEEPTTPEQPTTEEPTTEEPEPETSEAPLISTEVAIALAVVAACIIGAVAYLTLRKRK